jgi:hypothetical protein
MYVLTSSFSPFFPSDISLSPFNFALNKGKSRRFSIFGKEQEGNGNVFTSDYDLYFFLLGYHSSPFSLSSSSDDDSVDHDVVYCGISLFPCSSLSYLLMNNNEGDFSLDNHKIDGMSQIVIEDQISLSSSLSLQNVMMKSEEGEEKGKLKLSGERNLWNKEYFIEMKNAVSLNSLLFTFSSSFSLLSFSSVSFFLLNGMKFSIEECSFTIEDINSFHSPLSFSLFSLIDGEVSFKDSFFHHLSFKTDYPFLFSSPSPSSPSFPSPPLSLDVHSSLSLLMKGCSFKNVTSKKEKGKILSVDDFFLFF